MKSLATYQSKRRLSESGEPPARKSNSSQDFVFCIQKHDARRLHYDFRLEFKGALLSWAVPKGPSLNPNDKRLAVKVEDHPMEYRHFEGVIPKGNYGAGSVMVWDEGTYTVPYGKTRKEKERYIEEGLKRGHFEVILSGKKLRGLFLLQRLHAVDENNWLLIKLKDEFVSNKDVLKLDKSAVTSLSMEEIAHTLKPLRKPQKMPAQVSPMLATLIEKPFNDKNWVFEVKWDGFRAIAFINNDKIKLESRTSRSLNQKFPAIIEQLKALDGKLILDGELVIVDAKGKSSFQLMQNYETHAEGTLCYYVFDLLYKDGHDLRERPLIERKEILKAFLEEMNLPLIRYSAHIADKGIPFFKIAKKNNLEGIIGKRADSTYQEKRSRDWVKIKTKMRQEVIIGGFTAPRGSREKFGALLVGVYKNQKLIYAGHVGGGFNELMLKDVYKKLKPLIQKNCPFSTTPKPNMPVNWVKPLLVAEVAFTEWTQGKIMRHPIFQGLREDKPPKDVKKEEVSK